MYIKRSVPTLYAFKQRFELLMQFNEVSVHIITKILDFFVNIYWFIYFGLHFSYTIKQEPPGIIKTRNKYCLLPPILVHFSMAFSN